MALHHRLTGIGMRMPLLLLAFVMGCEKSPTMEVAGGDVERGRQLVQDYGCVACHTIPGVPHVGSNIGPPLSNMGNRVYIAGVIPNVPEQMILWLMSPPEVDPLTAMPDLGISEAEAKDIAAYLYTLH